MNRRLKPQPGSSTQEVLAGLVERITFHNAENGFCVIRVKARRHRRNFREGKDFGEFVGQITADDD